MHPSVYKRPLLWILAALIIGLSLFYTPAPGKRDVSRFLLPDEVTLIGQVDSFPLTKNGKQSAWLKISSLNGSPVTGRVYARLNDFSVNWKDTVQVTGKLQEPYAVDLPGNFNWQNYLSRKQTFAEIKVSNIVPIKPAAWLWQIIRRVRQDILRTLNQSFPPKLAGIAGGILLGERGDFAPDLYTAFQDSGAIHLLVASGGNVGFVTLLTLAVGVAVGLRRRPLLLVALLSAGLYTLIAGADAPLLRAYLMAVCACVGYFLGRNSGVLQGLILSGLIILCVTPAAVFDTGFQMSFLATLSIIVFLNNFHVPDKWPKAARFFAQIFLATLASQLALLPIFTNVFYKVSLTGLLSNMILVPLASVLMGISFAYYLLTLLHVGVILYYPCLWGLTLFQSLVEFFASFRFSSMAATAWNGGSIAAYYILLFWISQLPHKTFFKKLCVPCLLAALLCFGIGRALQNRPQLFLLNEWNHRAVIIKTNRKTALVFNDDFPAEKLERALHALGISKAAFTTSLDSFEMRWPGEEILRDNATVRATWELRQTRDGHVYQNTGYSGQPKEGLSYCVQVKKREVCIGSHAWFVMLPNGETRSYKPNGTVRLRW